MCNEKEVIYEAAGYKGRRRAYANWLKAEGDDEKLLDTKIAVYCEVKKAAEELANLVGDHNSALLLHTMAPDYDILGLMDVVARLKRKAHAKLNGALRELRKSET